MQALAESDGQESAEAGRVGESATVNGRRHVALGGAKKRDPVRSGVPLSAVCRLHSAFAY